MVDIQTNAYIDLLTVDKVNKYDKVYRVDVIIKEILI